MFIPMGTDVRVLAVRGAAGLTLGWELHPCLGTEDAAGLQFEEHDGFIRLRDAGAWLPGTEVYVGASAPYAAESDFCPAALCFSMQADYETLLLVGTDAEALRSFDADALLRATRVWWRQYLQRFSLDCADAPLSHYMNTWAVYQCYACRILAQQHLSVRRGDRLSRSASGLRKSPAH